MEHSRRSFLTGIAGIAGSTVSLGLGARAASGGPQSAPNASRPTSRSFLEIENQIVGPLVQLTGGALVADVEETVASDDTFFTKRPITPRVTPLEFTTNLNMEVAFWQRVGAILSHSQVPFSGAIVRTDANSNIAQRIEFTQAVFSESAVGALDAEVARETEFNFKLDFANLSRRTATGKVPPPTGGSKKGKSLTSNYRLDIDGIQGTESVFAIDAVSVVQPVERDPGGSPILGPLETSSLDIQIPERVSGDFYDWFENLVMRGDTADERVGTLVGLSTNFQTALWSVRLFNLGIFAIRPDPVHFSSTKVGSPTVRVSMYFERALVTLGPIPDL